jgi:hypothetical protein
MMDAYIAKVTSPIPKGQNADFVYERGWVVLAASESAAVKAINSVVEAGWQVVLTGELLTPVLLKQAPLKPNPTKWADQRKWGPSPTPTRLV